MSLISSIEHALAVGAQDIVKTGRFITNSIIPVLTKAKASEATIEGVTAFVSPAAVDIERVAFAVLGLALKAISDGQQAVDAKGLNLTLDAQTIADLKAILPAVKSVAPPVTP